MSLISLASGKSLWRGYEYYEGKRVHFHIQNGEFEYTGKVSGNGRSYDVHIDLKHPRKSTCNCPHADGKRIICKHIVATYFTVLPKEAERFYAEAMAYQEEEEKRQEEMSDKVIEYVGKMKKADLCQSLLELLFDGPEWQYDRFIREHGLDDDWY